MASALVASEWSALRLGRFIPGRRAPGTHWIGLGPRTGMDAVEKRTFLALSRLEPRPLGSAARRKIETGYLGKKKKKKDLVHKSSIFQLFDSFLLMLKYWVAGYDFTARSFQMYAFII
jgi:hypothetical protein